MSLRPRSSALVVALLLTSCTSSQTAQLPSIATPDVAKTSKLLFAVGTATIGVAGGGSVPGLNVVATFRSSDGNNATNANTPTITAPPDFTFGPLLGNSNVLTGFNTKQYLALENELVNGGTTADPNIKAQLASLSSGLGPYVGVFGYGLAADNRFSIDDSKIQNHLPSPGGGSPCLGLAFPGYLNGGGRQGAPAGVGFSTAPLGPQAGSFYGSYGSALGSFVPQSGVTQMPTFATIAEVERSAELALPIPSGPAQACGCPQSCAPDGSPLQDSHFPIQAFGGPPAWPSPQGYGNYAYFVGYPVGFADFAATPVAGSYTLSVSYPTSADYQSTGSMQAKATLVSVAGLPEITSPPVAVQLDGSGIITNLNVPAGVSEAMVLITASDCDLTGRELSPVSGFNHYAFVVHVSGPQPPIYIPPNLGPPGKVTGTPTHTFCTTSDLAAEIALALSGGGSAAITNFFFVQVQALGFDYPAYESSYPFTRSQTPQISGASGQSDVTTSYPAFFSYTVPAPASSPAPAASR